MARIIDTTPAFDTFARAAFMESPHVRERMWKERYEGAHREVFDAFYAGSGNTDGLSKVVRDLSTVRSRVRDATSVERRLIEEVEPLVQAALGLPSDPSPQHVLLVGSFSVDADVGRLRDDVTLFHCLEWFHGEEGMRVLVAHETTHAWHEIALGIAPPEDDAAWMAFYEGVGIMGSRAAVSGRPPEQYFWYGHGGFADWLPWCEEHRDELLERFAAAIDDPTAVETWFGGGLVEGRWRVGYYVADVLVSRLGRSLPDLVAVSVDDARKAIKEALA
ncbi:MAG TPA: hypothetical protein VK975_05815 [Acidimicrobiales bacterium]|nr:hypothetical protein [Acidimicrobiales bacterium]